MAEEMIGGVTRSTYEELKRLIKAECLKAACLRRIANIDPDPNEIVKSVLSEFKTETGDVVTQDHVLGVLVGAGIAQFAFIDLEEMTQ